MSNDFTKPNSGLAEMFKNTGKQKHASFLDVLVENHQAQIAGYYNVDKTDEERAKRNAVIEEYKDLIAIYKANFLTEKI